MKRLSICSKLKELWRSNRTMKTWLSIIVLFAGCSTGIAQQLCPANINEQDLSFNSDENLVYAASYSWGPIFVDVGEVSLDINKTQSSPTEFHIVANAKTYKFYDKFFRVRDFYEARFSLPNIRSTYFHRDINEGDYSIKNTYNFDWTNNTIDVAIEKRQKVRKLELSLDNCTLDVMTYFYYLRNLDFDSAYPNKIYTLSIVLDDSIHNIKCRYLGKEQKKVKSFKTKINCLKFTVEVVAGSVFKGDEKILLWISDDKNHVPLELESPIIVGKVRGRLLRYENLKYPLNFVKK